MLLTTLKEDTILDTLGLAHQYGFQELEAAVSDILKQLLALRNVCAILDTAHLYRLDKLVQVCHVFLDRHASEILTSDHILQLSQVLYNLLIKLFKILPCNFSSLLLLNFFREIHFLHQKLKFSVECATGARSMKIRMI